jgi:hypothetical protein
MHSITLGVATVLQNSLANLDHVFVIISEKLGVLQIWSIAMEG